MNVEYLALKMIRIRHELLDLFLEFYRRGTKDAEGFASRIERDWFANGLATNDTNSTNY